MPEGLTFHAWVLCAVGFGCVYVVFIAQNMVTLYDFGQDESVGQIVWMVITMLIFTPLTWVRTPPTPLLHDGAVQPQAC